MNGKSLSFLLAEAEKKRTVVEIITDLFSEREVLPSPPPLEPATQAPESKTPRSEQRKEKKVKASAKAKAAVTPEPPVLFRKGRQIVIDPEKVAALNDPEREILMLRTGLKDGNVYTLEEIGKKLGYTRERIRQIEAKALGSFER